MGQKSPYPNGLNLYPFNIKLLQLALAGILGHKSPSVLWNPIGIKGLWPLSTSGKLPENPMNKDHLAPKKKEAAMQPTRVTDPLYLNKPGNTEEIKSQLMEKKDLINASKPLVPALSRISEPIGAGEVKPQLVGQDLASVLRPLISDPFRSMPSTPSMGFPIGQRPIQEAQQTTPEVSKPQTDEGRRLSIPIPEAPPSSLDHLESLLPNKGHLKRMYQNADPVFAAYSDITSYYNAALDALEALKSTSGGDSAVGERVAKELNRNAKMLESSILFASRLTNEFEIWKRKKWPEVSNYVKDLTKGQLALFFLLERGFKEKPTGGSNLYHLFRDPERMEELLSIWASREGAKLGLGRYEIEKVVDHMLSYINDNKAKFENQYERERRASEEFAANVKSPRPLPPVPQRFESERTALSLAPKRPISSEEFLRRTESLTRKK